MDCIILFKGTTIKQNQDNIYKKKLQKKITCSSNKIICMLISSSVALLIESQTLITFTLMFHVYPLVVRSLNFFVCHIVDTLLEKKPYILAANSY